MSGGSINGRVVVEEKFTNEIVKRERINSEYAKLFRNQIITGM